MEGDSKERPNPEEGKNPLLTALETIISGNKEISVQLEKFSRNQGHILSGISGEQERQRKESGVLESLARALSAELEKKNQENQNRVQKILDISLQRFQTVELKLDEKDRGLLEKVDTVLKKFWKLPASIAAISLLMAVVTTFSAIKFYRESVRSKEELKQELAGELKAKRLILVDQKEWKNYGERDRLIEAWKKNNPRDAKSLEDYITGYEDFKKGKK